MRVFHQDDVEIRFAGSLDCLIQVADIGDANCCVICQGQGKVAIYVRNGSVCGTYLQDVSANYRYAGIIHHRSGNFLFLLLCVGKSFSYFFYSF